jgi:hypothetical protein
MNIPWSSYLHIILHCHTSCQCKLLPWTFRTNLKIPKQKPENTFDTSIFHNCLLNSTIRISFISQKWGT